MPVRDPVRGSVPLVGAPLLAQKMQKGARPVRQHYPVSGEEETAVSVDKLNHVLRSAKPFEELVHNEATASLSFPASGVASPSPGHRAQAAKNAKSRSSRSPCGRP